MFKFILLIVGIFLWGSCAQIGSLSGGDKDQLAPRVLASTPKNGQTNFHGNGIEIVFDEYIVLQNPSQTISAFPEIKTIVATTKKNKLILHWEDTLLPETTYSIQLNRTVKDYTEGNDSIMQFVFSTGSEIDSLTFETQIIYAFKQTPCNHCILGLYDSITSKHPTYYGLTNEKGMVQLNYLKEGNYVVKTFLDENKDLSYQATEAIGIRSTPLNLQENVTDSLPILLSKTTANPKLTALEFKEGRQFNVGANFNLISGKWYINDVLLSENQRAFIFADSVSLFLPSIAPGDYQVRYESDTLKLTLETRVLEKNLKKKFGLKSTNKAQGIRPKDPLSFLVPYEIKSVDTNRIQVINLLDSTQVPCTMTWEKNHLMVFLNRKGLEKIEIQFEKEAIQAFDTLISSPKNSFAYTVLASKNLGELYVDVSALPQPGIIDLMDDQQKMVESYLIDGAQTFHFKELHPGLYTFRYIVDDNKNGVWDPIQLNPLVQPEKVIYFTEKNLVRANWDIEVKLVPNE